ncbi:hypothetical protein SCWH03_38570 [Streptomyces pacificus]|uniref:HTH cro/C1-type domain-containing protein n=1 Tax=Streptomyces pacificus TaxID=2705029 RepID=A0A6A0AXF4_9ACTN|nr:hypothetical protein SCWH03_38570 [Streptomyces pacificus]
MAVSASSSARRARQALAERLADLCRDAGLTGLDLAERCGWSRSKSSRIMNAKTPPSADDIRAWCQACGAEDQTEDLIASLRTAEGMWVNWRRMERAGLKQAQEVRLPLYQRTRRTASTRRAASRPSAGMPTPCAPGASPRCGRCGRPPPTRWCSR